MNYSAGSLGWYSNLYDLAKLNVDDVSIANLNHARQVALQNRSIYESVEIQTQVPWYVVAAIHVRESNGDLGCALCNGQRIIGTNRKTTWTPAGRGPYATWIDSAVDALKFEEFNKITDWSLENILRFCEAYNGRGYLLYHPKVLSPYLWSCTSNYVSGLYTRDGHFDNSMKDIQCGIAALFKALEGIVTFTRATL